VLHTAVVKPTINNNQGFFNAHTLLR
jgi:hypothetical protein